MTRPLRCDLRAFTVTAVVTAMLAAPSGAPAATSGRTVHVEPGLFEPGGALGQLELGGLTVALADGRDASVLRSPPAMSEQGFPNIAFTVPPLEQELGFGPFATTVRLRIPGRDPSDPTTALLSNRVGARIAGPRLVLTIAFESEGAEAVAERPATGGEDWTRLFAIQADHLVVTVVFPLSARGASVEIGPPSVTAEFDFAAEASAGRGIPLEGTFAKDYVKSSIESALTQVLDLEAYRRPLGEALTAWLHAEPFSGLAPSEFRLHTATDGGLDVEAVTVAP